MEISYPILTVGTTLKLSSIRYSWYRIEKRCISTFLTVDKSPVTPIYFRTIPNEIITHRMELTCSCMYIYPNYKSLIQHYFFVFHRTSQVEIFRVSDVIREDEGDESLKAGGFYVMVKIRGAEEGSAAFMWDHLQQIIHKYFNISHAPEIDEYKVLILI